MNEFLFTLQQKLFLIKNLTNVIIKTIKIIYGRGAYESHMWRYYRVAAPPLMGNATVSNEKKMVDQKTIFIIKFVCGHGVYGSLMEIGKQP